VWPGQANTWVGLSANPETVLQTGTDEWIDSNNQAIYGAFWDARPFHSGDTKISMCVDPGDVMHASIIQRSATRWTLELFDNPNGKHKGELFATTWDCTGNACPGEGAELIHEYPNSGSAAALADTTDPLFSCATYSITKPSKGKAWSPFFTMPPFKDIVGKRSTDLIDFQLRSTAGNATPSWVRPDAYGFSIGVDSTTTPPAPTSTETDTGC
jgi:hypothetical protein